MNGKKYKENQSEKRYFEPAFNENITEENENCKHFKHQKLNEFNQKVKKHQQNKVVVERERGKKRRIECNYANEYGF